MKNSDRKKHLKPLILRIDTIFSYVESVILVITLGSMILIAFLQVILRNIFSSGILWGDILLRHLVLWVGFLGASLATKENNHISIDALSRMLNPVWFRRVRIFTNLFSAIICALLVRAAFVFIRDERAAGTTLFLGIPTWIFMIILLTGFISVSIRFLLKVFFPEDRDKIYLKEE